MYSLHCLSQQWTRIQASDSESKLDRYPVLRIRDRDHRASTVETVRRFEQLMHSSTHCKYVNHRECASQFALSVEGNESVVCSLRYGELWCRLRLPSTTLSHCPCDIGRSRLTCACLDSMHRSSQSLPPPFFLPLLGVVLCLLAEPWPKNVSSSLILASA